jgi:trans-4-hydroxy-L-proline dehydratase
LSPGRVDQYLYPYYRKDLESGKLTRDQAREILQCYFIKHNYAYDYMGRVGNNQGINSGFGQLITLGGIGPTGEDAGNELTELFLDVIEDLNLLEPKPNIRLHRLTPDALLDRIVDLLAKCQGAPFLLNFDETSMAALKWAGLPEDQLWNYAPVGCLENTLQGNDRSGTVDVNLNLAKAVELALFNGRDQRYKWRIGPRTGNPERFKDFEEFFQAYTTQLQALIDRLVESACEADAIRSRFEPTPYLSALVDGCAEQGKDVSAGGPWHNFITVEGVGLATAIDSLAAVKKLVFETKAVSMRELLRAIRANFKGHEALRQKLVNKAPKYGNDDPEADAVAHRLNDFFSRDVFGRASPATGRRFRAGYLSWNYWILYANSLSATPDGRPRGTYLSNGICPVTGVDRQGPTAVARSVWSVGLETVPNGASHTISFSPAILRTAAGREKLRAFLRGYGEQGGSALQVNLVSPELLREAQQEPERFHNLLVRVTGYNAYFTTLGQEIQNEIISRESHAVGQGPK